jgi:hypothetical protein
MADAPATLEEKINATIDTKLVDKADDKKEKKGEKPAAAEKKPVAKADDADDADDKDEKESEAKPGADDGDADDDADEDKKPDTKAKSGEEKKGENADEDDDEEDDDDAPITPEFKAALAKQRLDFRSLEGLSPKEQKVVFEHAKRLNQAFTRAQMEGTKFRKEKAEFETERTYQTKNPDRYIADLIVKNPDLLELVNKELERRQNPVYAEALEKDRAADKKLAQAAVNESESKAEEIQERVSTWNASTARAAKEAGLPEEFANEAVANAILQRRAEGEKVEDIELSDEEIDEIVAEQATIFRKHVGAHKAASTREAKNKYVKEKAEDAKNTKSVKPKAGSIERKPVTGEKPKDLGDFIDRWTTANVG